jgi:hypothetical protein
MSALTYNGTGATGGDPSTSSSTTPRLKPPTLTKTTNRHHQPQCLLQPRRPSLHHHRLRNGPRHDTWSRFPIFWSCTAEVCSQHDLGMLHEHVCHQLSVVLLGLLSGFQLDGNKWLHRQSISIWTQGCAGRTESRKSAHPGTAILILPGILCRSQTREYWILIDIF